LIKQDIEGKLVEFENQEFERQQEIYAKKYKEEKSILKEQEKEIDPDDISHYKHQWLLTIQNYARIKMLEKKLTTAREIYQKRVQKIQSHYQKHPEHDKEWLNYLSKIDYTEAQIECIRNGYENLKQEILIDNQTTNTVAASLPDIPSPPKISSGEGSTEENENKIMGEWQKISKNKKRKARRYKNTHS